jgi:PAS domain-containing protein
MRMPGLSVTALAPDDLPDPLFIIRDGRVIEANRRAGVMLGCSPGDLVGADVGAVFAPGEFDRLRELRRQNEVGSHPPWMTGGSRRAATVRGRSS